MNKKNYIKPIIITDDLFVSASFLSGSGGLSQGDGEGNKEAEVAPRPDDRGFGARRREYGSYGSGNARWGNLW